MKTFLMAASLTLCAVVGAQEAKIMILDRADSQVLKSAYYDYQAAQKKWESAKAAIAVRYTTVDGKVQVGWEKVQFSVDFRAMVPQDRPWYLSSGGTGITGIVGTSPLSISSGGSMATTGTFSTPATAQIFSSPSESDFRSDLSVRDSPKAK